VGRASCPPFTPTHHLRDLGRAELRLGRHTQALTSRHREGRALAASGMLLRVRGAATNQERRHLLTSLPPNPSLRLGNLNSGASAGARERVPPMRFPHSKPIVECGSLLPLTAPPDLTAREYARPPVTPTLLSFPRTRES
jgi:hypothetical protein